MNNQTNTILPNKVDINPFDANFIFVFDSNLAGRHGLGAALTARKRFGAEMGLGIGYINSCYAIPTKDDDLKVLTLEQIWFYLKDFIIFAQSNPEKTLFVTKVGTGLAGYSNSDIAPLFQKCPVNCIFHEDWFPYLGPEFNYYNQVHL